MKTIGILLLIPIIFTLEILLIPCSCFLYVGSIMTKGTITEKLINKL